MPKPLERKLNKQARKLNLSGDQADAYVYSTLRRTGWKPKSRGSLKAKKS